MIDEKDNEMDNEPLLLPNTHRELMRVARRRSAPHRTLRQLPRRRTIGVLATVSVLAGGTALAATTPWSPTVGDDHRGHPTLATTDVPADQLAAIAALRRPQDDSDRTPDIEGMLKALSGDLTAGIHLSSIRALSTRPDGATALFAADRDGNLQADLPEDIKHNVLCMLLGTHVDATPGGVQVQAGRLNQLGMKCGTTSELRQGKFLLGAQYAGRLTLNGVVPDGVSKVSLTLRTGQTVEAQVENNSFHIDQAAPNGSYEDAPIHWFDKAGHEVPQE
ncbi:hypothetical protein AB0L40_07450 [Patulibacter sp. NPDC049589]|uniref:hypothetical protein n=1 Tax=Patulibacter sp. NPDC049589 TaxID=3154731 RepID=UPI003442AAAF